MLSYNAPQCGTGPITLAGLSVTDNGFGVWTYTFPVTGGTPLGTGSCGTTLDSTLIEIIEEVEVVAS